VTPTLPPQTFRFSLPALSPDEAEQLLHFVDAIRELLWDAYAADVFDDLADDGQPDPVDPAPDDDGDF
jgi:hypothetical protein